MKKIYIARRIPKDSPSEFILEINSDMSVKDIYKLYTEKVCKEKEYIYNGPWILRAPLSEEEFSKNLLPKDLCPQNVWAMVKNKIESSDVVVGIVNGKAYGTIAEVSYACKCKGLGVYVLPDENVGPEELQDLWFLFQIIKESKDYWNDQDIQSIKEFSGFGIKSVADYCSFLESIVPNFMKK